MCVCVWWWGGGGGDFSPGKDTVAMTNLNEMLKSDTSTSYSS